MVVAPLVTSRVLYSGWSLAWHHRAQAAPDASQSACGARQRPDLGAFRKKNRGRLEKWSGIIIIEWSS